MSRRHKTAPPTAQSAAVLMTIQIALAAMQVVIGVLLLLR
jgi:hypothetical protein